MANVNYDPKAAHEYYMKHRKLKGKKHSTKGFGDTQKEQWEYVKEQLRTQQKEQNDSSKKRINAEKARRSEQVKKQKQQRKEQLKKQAEQKIDALRKKLKNMTPEQKARMRDGISNAIGTIRERLSADRAKVQQESSNKLKAIREKATADKQAASQASKQQYEKSLDDAYDMIARKKTQKSTALKGGGMKKKTGLKSGGMTRHTGLKGG